MKDQPTLRNLFMVILLALLCIPACKKGSDGEDADTTSTVDLALSEICYSRILLLAKHIAPINGDFSNVGMYTCAIVDSLIGDTSDFPTNGNVTVYLTFPDTGCVDIDERLKSGPINITYYDDLANVGAIAEVHFEEYITGLGRFRGQVNIARTSSSTFDVSFVDCKLYSSSYTIDYSGTAAVTMVAGETTEDPMDDEYTYTSELEGVDRDGRNFTASTTTPIEMKTNCAWNIEGYFSVDPTDRNARSLNYGDGTCDASLIVVADGQEFTIIMP